MSGRVRISDGNGATGGDSSASPGFAVANAADADKASIRRAMRARRLTLSQEEREAAARSVSRQLAGKLAELSARLRDGGVVAVYLASPAEIDLTNFIGTLFAGGFSVVSPRWNGREYTLSRLRSLQACDLQRGPMGIMESAVDDPVSPCDVALWVIPGLAFTRQGVRLGYGGGWYDRLLAAAGADAVKIGVAYPFQVVPQLPCQVHDVVLSGLVVAQ